MHEKADPEVVLTITVYDIHPEIKDVIDIELRIKALKEIGEEYIQFNEDILNAQKYHGVFPYHLPLIKLPDFINM